jgi:hypothetical protein
MCIDDLLIDINSNNWLGKGIKIKFKEFIYSSERGKVFVVYRNFLKKNLCLYKSTSIISIERFLVNFLKNLQYYPQYLEEKYKDQQRNEKLQKHE